MVVKPIVVSTYISVMMAENVTTTQPDVMTAGCYGDTFHTVACIRYSVMCFVMLITAVLSVVRIVRLHKANHQMRHHYFIFYAAGMSSILCLAHWLLEKYAQLDFSAQWFKQISYLVVTHFCWIRVYRAMGREKLTAYCLMPCLIAGFLYLTGVVAYGMAAINNYDSACYALQWLLLSTAELLIVLMFLVAAFFINQRLNTISTNSLSRREQKCKLWTLVVVFLFVAIVGASYDIAMMVLSNAIVDQHHGNCDIIYAYSQVTYSTIFGTFMMIKFAMPVWVMLHVLQPLPTSPYSDDNAIDDETYSYQDTDPLPINASEAAQRRLHFNPNYHQPHPRSNLSNAPNLTPVTEERGSLRH